MKKKITVCVLLVVMLVGILGSVSVSAETVDDFDFDYLRSFDFSFYSTKGGEVVNAGACNVDNLLRSYLVRYSMENYGDDYTIWFSCYFVVKEPVSQVSGICWINDGYFHDRVSSVPLCREYTVNEETIYVFRSSLGVAGQLTGNGVSCAVNAINVDEYLRISGSIDEEMIANYYFTGEMDGLISSDKSEASDGFDESTATYEKDLGYLMNVKCYGLYDNKQDEANTNFLPTTGSGTLKFVWDSTSTTGVDLSDENIFVRFSTSAGAVGATSNSPNTQLITDSERNYYKNFPAGDCSIMMTYDEFHSISDSDYQAWYDAQSFWDKYTKGIVRRDTAYFQLVRKNDDGTWSYGGYVKMTFGRDTSSIKDESILPSGEKDETSLTNGKVPFISGSGSTVDDAFADAQEKESASSGSFWSNWEDVGDVFVSFMEGLSNLQESLGNFPAIVAKVFSGMPSSIILAICIGIPMAVVLRLLGR